MRTRLTAAALAAAALLALTACSSSDSNDDKGQASPTTPVPTTTVGAAPTTTTKHIPGFPDAPTGAKRTAYLAALRVVDPAIVADPDKAITAGRNQCTSLDGGARNPDHSAAERFGNDARPLSDAQGKLINAALRQTICPKK
ncbi:DUF732 domain-containing protein [Streptomyces sp. NPDC088197]|uniref:DUF732 domain-containing protein n=1 Tax=Streptomyces sp. NPDC088197 TaxID=3365840 RepID=UPI0037FB4CA6